MKPVRVWMEKMDIPTYPVGAPDRNPMFLDRRVYQGSSGRVYPHAVTDTVSDEKVMKTYTALCLENEYLYVMVLPELGGRVQRALDKTNGYDFVYYNHVIKPAMVGLAGPWISGGIEFNWPQHHRPSTFDPVPWQLSENPDGSCSILVGEIEQMFRTKGMSRLTLRPGKAYLEIENQLFNRTGQVQTFLWWANPAVAVNDHTRSIFPPDVYAVMDHGKRDVSDFPIAHGVYYKMDYSAGVDISRYKNIPVPTSYMAAHSDYDFVGNYDDARQAGMLHVADHHVSPGKKQWTWGNGEFGQAWDRNLTDSDGPYIELMAGCFTDNQPDFSFLMPGEEKRFTQYFLPYKQVGAVKNATRDVLVGLERADGQVTATAYVTGVFPGCVLTIEKDGAVIAEKREDLTPEAAAQLTARDPGGLLTVRVRDRKGRTLVVYREKPQDHQTLPEPATAIPAPKDVPTGEKLWRYGTHLEQYRHATWDPMDYYQEGLRRDPDDVRLNVACAKLLVKRGLIAESEAYLRRAVASATEKNPNPYDGECFYQLGLTLALLGRDEEAYDAFYKSAWNGAWQSAAYYRLGCIALRQGDAERALEHLTLAVERNSRDMLARDARTMALRLLGRGEEAAALARETLRLDPLDAVASRELSLLTGTEECWDAHLSESPSPFIELALEYARCGLREDAASVLRTALRHGESLLAYIYLSALTGDETWLNQAAAACPDGCFPHRQEDCLALESALCAQPGLAYAHYALGNYWYDKGQWQQAMACWEACIRLKSSFATAHRNLALVYYNRANRPMDALREMETAFACDPSDARVLMELDALCKKLNVPASDRLSALEASPSLLGVRDDLAIEYAALLNQAGRHQDALDWINSRRFHPWEGGEGKAPAQWRIALMALAREAMAQHSFEKAEALLTQAAGPYPHHLGEGRLPSTSEHDALYWLGRCLEQAGRSEDARTAYAQAAAGDCDIGSVLYYNDQPPERLAYQGLALRRLGREKEAMERFHLLRSYAKEHMHDRVRTEYFAVSLPELQIFDEDLTLRSHVQCLILDALGALGEGDGEGLRCDLDELRTIAPYHQSLQAHVAALAQV